MVVGTKYRWMIARGGHPWDIIRNNRLIKSFLDSEANIFVKMDADQIYPADYFKTMVPLVEECGVVGPLIMDRQEQSGFMPLAFDSHDNTRIHRNDIRWDVLDEDKLMKVPYTHTNNFYDKRVLEQISPPWYEAYADAQGLDRANHVDFNFLDKIRKVSEIWLHCGVVVEHMYTRGITKDDAKKNQGGILYGGS